MNTFLVPSSHAREARRDTDALRSVALILALLAVLSIALSAVRP